MENIYKLKNFAKAVVILLFAAIGLANAQPIVYVATDGTGDGSTWATATGDIQAVIDAALVETQVWIKAGTYYTSADTTLQLKEGVSLYGGFAGTETSPLQRTDFGLGGANETAISGDIDKNGVNDAGNATIVIWGKDITSATKLSGLTFRDGYGDVSSDDGGGAGFSGGNITIENCTFAYNYCGDNGGGLFLRDAASPSLTNCVFTANLADDKGGAFYLLTGCDATFTNCLFNNNSAITDGGAARVYQSSPTITNCTFVNNSLNEGNGTALDVSATSVCTVINSVFWGNVLAGVTGNDIETSSTSGEVVLTNCAFEGSAATSGTITPTDVIDISATDPLFTNTSGTAGNTGYNAASDWSLQTGSPLINAGLVAGAPAMDITMGYRDATPDIGAYEFNAVVPVIVSTDINGEGTVDPFGTYLVSGSSQTFTLTPAAGYEITAASFGGTDILSSLSDNGDGSFDYAANSVTSDAILAVTFEPLAIEYTVTVSAGTGGSISPTGEIKMTVTDETVFTITPDANFVVESLDLNGTSVLDQMVDTDGTLTYTLTGVGETTTLSVGFTAVYTISVSAGANGSIDPSGDVEVTVNDETVFTITPAIGYNVATLTLNSADAMGNLVDNGDGSFSYTMTGVSANATLAVTFVEYVANITYVKAGGTGDGSSWANATGSIQDALFASSFGDEVWVAKGKYLTPGNKVDSSFTLVNGVSLYGGFAGTETSVDQRKNYRMGEVNETKLSADLDGNGFLTGGNGARVVFGEFLNEATTVDGFTITGGFSDVEGSNGAGMKLRASTANILNCTFFDNYSEDGSHLYLYRSGDDLCSPTVQNCYFIKGYAFDDGGALYAASGTMAKFINCVFANNYAGDEGGAIRNYECSPEYINCTFVYNALPDADASGGGTYGPAIRNYQTSAPYMNTEPKIVNCVFWRNQDGASEHSYDISNTGGMVTAGAFATISFSAIMDSLSSSSCIVSDTVDIGPEDGSIVNPGFVDVSGSPGYQGYNAASDWNLVSTSVLIGRGTTAYPGAPETDLRGFNRGTTNDIGAFQYGEPNGVKVNTKVQTDILVYPNPTAGLLMIESQDGNISKLQIIDITGRVVHQFENKANDNITSIDLSRESKGIYFLKIENIKGNISTQKVVVK